MKWLIITAYTDNLLWITVVWFTLVLHCILEKKKQKKDRQMVYNLQPFNRFSIFHKSRESPKYWILYSALWVSKKLGKIRSRQKLPIVCAPEKAYCLFHKCMKQLQPWTAEQLQWFAKGVWIINVQSLIIPIWETRALCANAHILIRFSITWAFHTPLIGCE